MKTSINWLHLTDWHVGRSAQGHLWPNLRGEFERDLRDVQTRTGPIDLVLITGDLVQSGERKQFHELEQNLKRLWEFFESVGSHPVLVTTVGNHDLRRPDAHKSATLALAGWNQQPAVQDTFWANAKSDLRKTVEKAFEEYTRWWDESKIPMLRGLKGPLPGDTAATFEKNGLRVAVVTLNTSFLQLSNADYEGGLSISARQLVGSGDGDHLAWLEHHHISMLATHHPAAWFSDNAREEFFRDVAPAGRFHIHLSGHLHAGKTALSSEGGGPLRLTHQGASLFGLELFGHERKAVRTHGYLAGQWQLDDDRGTIRLWPRLAVTKQGGALGLVAAPDSYLDDDDAIEYQFTVSLSAADSPSTGNAIQPSPTKVEVTALAPDWTSSIAPNIGKNDATKKLGRALRFASVAQAHHAAVREDERQRFAKCIEEEKCAWIVADWGMGKDGFIASVIRSDTLAQNEAFAFEDRVFQMRCDTVENVADLEQTFRPQFGLTLPDFLQCIAAVGPSCLILDGIQAALTEGTERSKLTHLLDLVLDYAPLSIVVVSRTSIPWRVEPVEIHPLDLPDLRAYVQNHPDSQPTFSTADVLERIFEASGGLPVHIDRMLERLRVASFDAVLEEESALVELAAIEAPQHKALQQAIAAVRKRDEENGSRALPLLKSLSVLVYGETIEQLKYFLPGQSFYPRDAESLHSAALIEPIPLSAATPLIVEDRSSRTVSPVGPKVLRVPKQVRDCVVATLLPGEKKDLLDAAGEFFFGRGWRIGKKPKLRKIPAAYRDYVAHGVGNEYAVLQSMILYAKDAGDEVYLKAASRLGLHYCGILKGADRNRDLRLAAMGLLRLLEGTPLLDEVAELNRLCGRACRMTNYDAEAVAHFEASLQRNTGRRSESRSYALLEMVDSLRSTGDTEKASDVAKQVEAVAPKGSLLESQVKMRRLASEPSEERTKSLLDLKGEARSKNWISHGNDLALTLFFETDDTSKKFALLDEVLASKEDGWNRYRSSTEKGLLCVRRKELNRLTRRDRRDLVLAYSYSHMQRLDIFDRCHEALWGILEAEHDYVGLYRLFKHSSFIWRIRGEDNTELNYFERLKDLTANRTPQEGTSSPIEVRYFIKRAAVLLVRLLAGRDTSRKA